MASPPPSTHIAESLLRRAHSPSSAATLFRERVQQRPLLLRPSSPDPARNARSRRQHERLRKAKALRKTQRKPRPLSAAQQRALGVHAIPAAQRRYALFAPLHVMWCAYMREILGVDSAGGKSWVGGADALASADYHGARLEVVRSRCVSRVGITGIVVRDTKFAFELVTEQDAVKLVPKEHTVFRFEVPFEEKEKKPLAFEIYGSRFQNRPADRANRKFKMHVDPDV